MTLIADLTTAAGLGHALLNMALFGLLGLALLLIGFKAFDLITPGIDLEKELAEHNVAVALVVAAVLLGVAAIAVMAMA